MRTEVISSLLILMSSAALAQEIPPEEEAALLAGLPIEPSGITADEVARRAMDTSFQAAASEAALKSAAARVDSALVAFFPRLGSSFSYARYSDYDAQSLGTLVASTGQPGPITQVSSDPSRPSLVGVPFKIEPVLDNALLQANITIPISDYFLRINRGWTAATQARAAARLDLGAARAKAAAEGKLALYTWLRADGALVVARLALDDQRTHLRDTRAQVDAGNASIADRLRVETAVAAAELAVTQAESLVAVSEQQLRVALHLPEGARLTTAERIDAARLPPVGDPLPALVTEAQKQRFEARSLEANAEAVRAQAKLQRAAAFPTLGAFASVEYGNPNPRVFPPTDTWSFTWEAGAKIAWSPNDVGVGVTQGREVERRAEAIEAQRRALLDGLAIEVTQAAQAVQVADFSLVSTGKQLTSAREAVRVARQLFNNGRATSTTLTDAETELTRARLAVLNARIDARTSRVRLEHALGRDNARALPR